MKRVALAALILGGCVSTSPLPGPGSDIDAKFALADAPDTVVMHCENVGGWNAIYRGGYHAPLRYAECKDKAESLGLVRVR